MAGETRAPAKSLELRASRAQALSQNCNETHANDAEGNDDYNMDGGFMTTDIMVIGLIDVWYFGFVEIFDF